MFSPKPAVGLGLLALWLGLGALPAALADTACSATVPCEVGCCGKNLICGTGPDYCSKDKCVNNCDYKAECNPGDWDAQYYSSASCPLNVCCSKYGFCGTTAEFCGDNDVTRPSCSVDSQSITRVIGYYNSAAATRECGGMTPYGLPQGVYSHVYFAFGTIDPKTFKVLPATSNDEQLYLALASTQSRDLGQEMWLSIGGWTFSDAGSATATTFSDLANADITYQNVFFASLTLFMMTWGFTGVDIDWEYPAADDRNGRAADYASFPVFLKNLKAALDTYKYGLSITLPTSYWYLQHFDLKAIEPHIDWFNYMAYDLHGTWDIGSQWTGAYLNAHSNLTEIKTAMDLLWRNDVPPAKVNLGLAFYGRSFTVASASCTEPGCAYLSAGDAGRCSATAGILMNSEISDLIAEHSLTPKLYKDAAVKVVTWNGDQWVSFDDQDTFKIKADYAKSVCLGGVLVWAVDQDDATLTYSDGLAAALGNPINVDNTTGLTITLTGKAAKANGDSSVPDQNGNCRWINCGETCPAGFTTVVRDDNKKQLMLNSAACHSSKQTQTLCCPTSTDVPTCQWRGFHGGKCKGGCNDGEAEVGTVSTGCRSGYQSACCTVTPSTQAYADCAWTDDCYDADDKTCPSGFPVFVVNSRNGWGGQRSCKNKKQKHNYCCKGSAAPDAFQDCAWYGYENKDTSGYVCGNSCPAGAIPIAGESINTWGTNDVVGQVTGCMLGDEAYCCKGATATASVAPRASPTTYQDQTAQDFDAYLNKFLAAPVCTEDAADEYASTVDKKKKKRQLGAEDTSRARNASGASSMLAPGHQKRATDQSITLQFLIPIMASWLSSEYPRTDLTQIWNDRLAQYGYSDTAARYTDMEAVMYQGSWTTQPTYSAEELAAIILCDITTSHDNMDAMAQAGTTLCDETDDGTLSTRQDVDSGLQRRHIAQSSALTRARGGLEPTTAQVLQGILNGDLSLHYVRYLSASDEELLMEIAFWIGSQPGVAPTAALRAQYGDAGHTSSTAVDRWIIMHLHIPLDARTFEQGNSHGRFVGVTGVTVYHGQFVLGMGRADPRVDYRYTSTYRNGELNVAPYRNYGARAHVLACSAHANARDRRENRWYLGAAAGASATDAYTQRLYRFGQWLQSQGTFSNANLAYVFPTIGNWDGEQTTSWATTRRPQYGAFTTNWLPDGSSAPDLNGADP